MRRWFVIFLIVLLPWRAWAGDAMTLAMTAPGEHAAAAASPHCADHPSATDLADADDPAPHAVCDICNGPALATAAFTALGPEPLPQALEATGPVRFVSALPRAGRKPPIS
jgi:hypothetical protein